MKLQQRIKRIYPLLVIMTLTFSISAVKGQVAIYPVCAYIDPATKTGSMQIINTSDEVKEVDIRFKFGYIDYDSLGNSFLQWADTVKEQKYSLTPYITVYPKKLIIPPKEQQVIRFLVKGLPDGTQQSYWTRIIASAIPASPQYDTSTKEGKVKAAIIFRTEMIGMVIIYKGKNNSKTDIDSLRTFTDSSKLNLMFKYLKTGDFPYWGTMTTQIYNSSNEMIMEKKEPIAVYFNAWLRFPYDAKLFKPGKYQAKVAIINERDELPEEFRPAFIPREKSFNFELK